MNDKITADQITTVFVVMAVAPGEKLRGMELVESVVGLQSRCISALLNDESGVVRADLRERFENLAAHYAEFDTREHPWEI
jgi:hypothetical protein